MKMKHEYVVIKAEQNDGKFRFAALIKNDERFHNLIFNYEDVDVLTTETDELEVQATISVLEHGKPDVEIENEMVDTASRTLISQIISDYFEQILKEFEGREDLLL